MGKDKKVLNRKEARKQERQLVKQSKQAKHQAKAQAPAMKAPGPLQQLLAKKQRQQEQAVEQKQKNSKAKTKAPPVHKDPYLEQEEMELARLGKLLGIDKKTSRKKSAEKLNKEYDLFEGMGDGFGDFLMELDDLTDMVEGKSDRKTVFHGRDDDDADAGAARGGRSRKFEGHMIDEDEQEASDIDEESAGMDDASASDGYIDENEEAEESFGEQEDEEDSGSGGAEGDYDEGSDSEEGDEEEGEEDSQSQGSLQDSGEEGNSAEDSDDMDYEDEEEGSDGSEGGEDGEEGEDSEQEPAPDTHVYRPTKGEDIYGRSTAAVEGGGDKGSKYVPPAKRKAALLEVDESSESVQALRRQLNGLMNKLSEQSKDAIVRAIKTLFDKNSVTVATLVLKDAIFAACAHPTQVMTSLIPIYAAVVAALHNSVSIDVGGTLVEHLTAALIKSLGEATAASSTPTPGASQSAGYIGTKLPANALLLLVYLYNLRVIHHTLIVDIMNALADCSPIPSLAAPTATSSTSLGGFVELKVELLELLINHCGVSIRGDDPVSLKAVITTLSKRLGTLPAELSGDSSRLRFMFEALTDLKNNKSRRIQTSNADVVKHLRKWLGGVKAALGQKQAGDTCMRVSLQDLLSADTKGRWWRTGASWVGKQQEDAEREEKARLSAAADAPAKRAKTSAEKSEEEQLLRLAAKLRMNTTTRKNIFVVMMSSRDVTDAFERLSRLELKGKEDREVARVLSQCCAMERTYNPFYAELAKMLCTQHRQYKVTFQFVFWDAFKAMQEGSEEGEEAAQAERKAVNLARLMAALVCSFYLPLTVLKPLDISNMSAEIVLFLSTLLLALFKDKIPDEDYQNVLDRVATSKDFAIVRDNLLIFLQKYLPSIPKGLDAADSKKMAQRRKLAVRTFEAMSVLDVAKGAMKEEEG